MYQRIKIFCALLLLTLGNSNGQEISIQSSLDRDSALIGEQFDYTIRINSQDPIHSFVPLDDNLFPSAVEVISETTDSVISEGSMRNYYIRYTITSFDSGKWSINSIPVLVNDFTDLDTIFTTTRSVVFLMPEVDTSAAIKDIKEPIDTPFKLSELLPYAPYLGGVFVLIAIALLVYFMIKRRKKEKDLTVPSLPPHIKAFHSLDRIKKEKIWQKGEVKEYYDQLSDTIRLYIEQRFNIPAMESVTWEILEDFKKHSWEDESLMDLLESLLQLSDLVKFAKEDPSPSENETNLNNAYIFVEKTKRETAETLESQEKV